MRYTIEGFSQEKLLEFSLNIKHVFILKFISTCCSVAKMHTKKYNNKYYTWIKYEFLLKEYPILDIPNTKQLGVYIKQLKDKGFLDLIVDRTPIGPFTYICLTDKFLLLKTSSPKNYNPTAISEPTLYDSIVEGSNENRSGNAVKSETNNPITINPITINPNNINKMDFDNYDQKDKFSADEQEGIQEFIVHRVQIKKAFTQLAFKKFINILLKQKNKGLDIIQLMDIAIAKKYDITWEPEDYKKDKLKQKTREKLEQCTTDTFEKGTF